MSEVFSRSTLSQGILALQDAKRELARAALSGEGARNVMKLTLNDLMGESPPDYGPSGLMPQHCSNVVDLVVVTRLTKMRTTTDHIIA